jgi:hypothetical protein
MDPTKMSRLESGLRGLDGWTLCHPESTPILLARPRVVMNQRKTNLADRMPLTAQQDNQALAPRSVDVGITRFTLYHDRTDQ